MLVQGPYSEAKRPLTALPTAANGRSVGCGIWARVGDAGSGTCKIQARERECSVLTWLAQDGGAVQYSSPLPCKSDLPVLGDFGGGWLGRRHRPKTGVYTKKVDGAERVYIGSAGR